MRTGIFNADSSNFETLTCVQLSEQLMGMYSFTSNSALGKVRLSEGSSTPARLIHDNIGHVVRESPRVLSGSDCTVFMTDSNGEKIEIGKIQSLKINY
jgi:hypothetical protein